MPFGTFGNSCYNNYEFDGFHFRYIYLRSRVLRCCYAKWVG